jgi:prolyl-tRNA synthetase
MKDAYSLDSDEEGPDRQYRALHRAYFRVFARCGLPAVAVGADVGIMGGNIAHEFMYLSCVGEDTILLCNGCGYNANRQVAKFRKPAVEPEQQDGRRKPVVMGSYGIGVGRLLACIAEEHRDEDGLVWAVCVAPYHVRRVASEHEAAPSLYEGLASAGVEVLYDDRRESLGTKFKDADLIGAPVRLTLTPRSLNSGGVEMKLRRERGSRIVPVDEAVEVVQQRLSELEAELLGTDSRR